MNIQPLNTWITKGKEPLIIAGPCAAETREQVLLTATAISQIPAVKLFRAGIWKPRTRPNSFEGVGEEGLKWLNEVQQLGLKTTVEVAHAQHVELALKYKMDVLWIGARTTGNPFSVQEIADALKGVDVPVMVKNPVHADLHLWIGALERIANAGINKLVAVHRGFHVVGEREYRNKPLWEMTIELKTLFPGLPIICDPSHMGGKREFVEIISQKALNIGMNGLMVEAHSDQDNAWSDAAQQISPAALKELLDRLLFPDISSTDAKFKNKLKDLRSMVDEVDYELIGLLAKRFQIIGEMALCKKEQNITVFQLDRWQQILRTRTQWAKKLGVSKNHVKQIFQLLHEESIRLQDEVMNKKHRKLSRK